MSLGDANTPPFRATARVSATLNVITMTAMIVAMIVIMTVTVTVTVTVTMTVTVTVIVTWSWQRERAGGWLGPSPALRTPAIPPRFLGRIQPEARSSGFGFTVPWPAAIPSLGHIGPSHIGPRPLGTYRFKH